MLNFLQIENGCVQNPHAIFDAIKVAQAKYPTCRPGQALVNDNPTIDKKLEDQIYEMKNVNAVAQAVIWHYTGI